MKVSSALIVCGGYRARALDLLLIRAECWRLTRKVADAVLYRRGVWRVWRDGEPGCSGLASELAAPGTSPRPRPVRRFLRLGIEKAKPRGWPFGASSFLEGECKHAQNPTSEHPKAKPRSFAGFGVSISSCRGVVQEDLAGMISAPTP
jgi:hypothetical protein